MVKPSAQHADKNKDKETKEAEIYIHIGEATSMFTVIESRKKTRRNWYQLSWIKI